VIICSGGRVSRCQYLTVTPTESVNTAASALDHLLDKTMIDSLPELSTLRRYADGIYWLFHADKDIHQTSCRRAAIIRDPLFQAVPGPSRLRTGECPGEPAARKRPFRVDSDDVKPYHDSCFVEYSVHKLRRRSARGNSPATPFSGS
jgi:hypothetical protein